MAWPEGVERRILDEVDSTNAEAARLASDGSHPPIWIMARRQIAGRGRQGRVWAMPEGNLAASHLSYPDCTVQEAGQRSFIASLAVADLLGTYAPRADIRVKWPNDVLINGRKACGILLESASDRSRITWLSVGVGVNLADHPGVGSIAPGTAPATSLIAEGGEAVTPDQALVLLATRFQHWQQIAMTQGFQAIRAAWLARAARLGERIEARLPAETIAGLFDDVDAEGSLVLRTSTGIRRIAAADVYFPE